MTHSAQEMAERRTRDNHSDRRLISERTAKSLRIQAARLHVYRDRCTPNPGLTRLNSHEYLGFDVDRSEDDEEDGSETTQVYELGGVPEGVRLGHNLYEAYEPTIDAGRDFTPPASSSTTRILPVERVTSPRPLLPQLRPLPPELRTMRGFIHRCDSSKFPSSCSTDQNLRLQRVYVQTSSYPPVQ